MPADIENLLRAAAPLPLGSLDVAAIRRRGATLRRRRRVFAVALIVPALAAGAWTSAHSSLFDASRPTEPAGGAACQGVEGNVSVFLRSSASRGEADALAARIEALPHVDGVTYFSQAEAFAELKRIYREKRAFWATLELDALPASLRVRVDSVVNDDDVAAKIPEPSAVVEEVRYSGIQSAPACRLYQLQRRHDALKAETRRLRHHLDRVIEAESRCAERAARRAARRPARTGDVHPRGRRR